MGKHNRSSMMQDALETSATDVRCAALSPPSGSETDATGGDVPVGERGAMLMV
jgi:hypothetical protein